MTYPALSLYERIGVDLGRRLRLEDGLEWAGRNKVRFIDVQLDTAPNEFSNFDDERCQLIRSTCERYGIHLGLHTLSAVNVAEYSPILSEAVDAYLRGYIDVYGRLGAKCVVIHAGYHFTSDIGMRMAAGLDRLKRLVDFAEKKGALLLLENLNKEPPDAEVHYLAHTVDEWRYYYEKIDSPAFALSFTANHAHLLPEGVDGFLDAIPSTASQKYGLLTAIATARKSILCPAGEISISEVCFGSLRSKASKATT